MWDIHKILALLAQPGQGEKQTPGTLATNSWKLKLPGWNL